MKTFPTENPKSPAKAAKHGGGGNRTREECPTGYDALKPLRGKGPAFVIEQGPLNTPCLIWQGCLNSKGYAVRGTKDRRYLVHRDVYEQEHGPIADGAQVHHRCENTRCVNVDHLDELASLAHARTHALVSTAAIAAITGSTGVRRVPEIAEELDATHGAVRAALLRGARRGEIRKVGFGRYAAIEHELEQAA